MLKKRFLIFYFLSIIIFLFLGLIVERYSLYPDFLRNFKSELVKKKSKHSNFLDEFTDYKKEVSDLESFYLSDNFIKEETVIAKNILKKYQVKNLNKKNLDIRPQTISINFFKSNGNKNKFNDYFKFQTNTQLITLKSDGYETHGFFMDNNKKNLVVLLNGHGGFMNSENKEKVINYINNRYDILILDMPFIGTNRLQENKEHGKRKKYIRSTNLNHQTLNYTNNDNSYLDNFIYPHVQIIQNIFDKKTYNQKIILGISGGGMLANVVSNYLPKVDKILSFAGDLPKSFIVNEPLDIEYHMFVQGKIDYYDFYFHNYYRGAKVYLIYNNLDTCCFAYPFSESFKKVIDNLKLDNFNVIINDLKEHKINLAQLKKII